LRIVSRDPQRIKQTMLYHLTNMGQPFIYVVDGNYCNRGELYLAHKHNGLDIEIKFAVETLKNLYKIWQRPVHPAGEIDDDMILFSFAAISPSSRRFTTICRSRRIRRTGPGHPRPRPIFR
jgi:stage V sporulation protein R